MVLIRSKGGNRDFIDAGGGMGIKLYLFNSKEMENTKNKKENRKELLSPCLAKITNMFQNIFDSEGLPSDILRILVYQNEKDDFFTIVFIFKVSSRRIKINNLRYYISSGLKKENISNVFLISNYDIHKSMDSCVWDVYNAESFPFLDFNGGELEEFFDNLKNLKNKEDLVSLGFYEPKETITNTIEKKEGDN